MQSELTSWPHALLSAARPFATVTDLSCAESLECIRRRRYGRIESEDGSLASIRFRPWPKYISVAEVWWQGRRVHRHRAGDRCLLYYNQPSRIPAFLAVTYVVSSRDCRYATLRAALDTLDHVARLKGTSAALCELSNDRITDRAMRRAGWERHVLASRRRHYIRRYDA